MANLPILLIFGLLIVGYAAYSAYIACERRSRTAPLSVFAALAAAALIAARHLMREPLLIYAGGLAVCAVVCWHLGNIGPPDNG